VTNPIFPHKNGIFLSHMSRLQHMSHVQKGAGKFFTQKIVEIFSKGAQAMARKSPAIEIREISDIENIDPQVAHQSARVMIAHDVAELIKSLIAQGKLEIKDGQIAPRNVK
jgi:hypothetical protein